MLKPYILVSFAILSFIFSMASRNGAGSAFGIAATGAPGESGQTCARSGCHRTGTFDPTTTVEVFNQDGETVSEYLPGLEYTVTVTISASSGTPGGYGFQMVALKDDDNSDLNSWVEDFESGIRATTLLGRRYIEHFGPNTSSNSFSVNWTAPEEGSGGVSFYATGLAVNRNGSTSGDADDNTSFTLGEGTISSINGISVENDIDIFPNPTTDYINVRFDQADVASYRLFNIIGKRITSGNINSSFNKVDMTMHKSGVYLLSLFDETGTKLTTRKIVKK